MHTSMKGFQLGQSKGVLLKEVVFFRGVLGLLPCGIDGWSYQLWFSYLVQEHPWITKSGHILISTEENCGSEIEVNEDEVKEAVTKSSYPIHILVRRCAPVSESHLQSSVSRLFSVLYNEEKRKEI